MIHADVLCAPIIPLADCYDIYRLWDVFRRRFPSSGALYRRGCEWVAELADCTVIGDEIGIVYRLRDELGLDD